MGGVMHWNKTAIKRFIEFGKTRTLVIDFENKMLANAHVIIFIDNELQSYLDEMLITQSVFIRNGIKQEDLPVVKTTKDSAIENCTQPTADTMHYYDDSRDKFKIYKFQERCIYLNENFFKIFHKSIANRLVVKCQESSRCSTSPVIISAMKQDIAMFLPARIETAYKLTKTNARSDS